jgi:ribose transport system permease protein
MTNDEAQSDLVPDQAEASAEETGTQSGKFLTMVSSARIPALGRFSGVLLWITFIIVFAIWIPDTFLTTTTVNSIVADQAITVILSVGLLFTLAAGCFDISVAQNLGLCAVLAALLSTTGHLNPIVVIIVTLLVGAGIGMVNGLLVAVVGIDSFIATLGTSSILVAATSVLSNNSYVGPVSEGFQNIAGGTFLKIPKVAIYALVASLAVWYVLEHTPLGRRISATGAGREVARLTGVPTKLYIFGCYVTTGVFAAIAGVLLVSKIGTVSQDVGPPYLLPAFAACFLGTTQLKLGRFNVWGTVLAIYLLATGVEGLQLVGGQLWITSLFNGVALIAAVSFAVLSQKRRRRAVKASR